MTRQTEWLLRTAAFTMLVIGFCLVVAGCIRLSALLMFVGSTIDTLGVGILVGLLIYWSRHPTLQIRRMTRPNEDMRRFSKLSQNKFDERDAEVLDEHGKILDADDPVARAVNAAWRSGKTIIWNEGDPLP